MKLFITNKTDLDADLGEHARRVHQLMYNQLNEAINMERVIPIEIIQHYEGYDVMLTLESCKNDLYFYTFNLI